MCNLPVGVPLARPLWFQLISHYLIPKHECFSASAITSTITSSSLGPICFSFLLVREHADLRGVVVREDDQARGGSVLHDRRRESEDPSPGGHPPRRKTAHLVGSNAPWSSIAAPFAMCASIWTA